MKKYVIGIGDYVYGSYGFDLRAIRTSELPSALYLAKERSLSEQKPYYVYELKRVKRVVVRRK